MSLDKYCLVRDVGLGTYTIVGTSGESRLVLFSEGCWSWNEELYSSV